VSNVNYVTFTIVLILFLVVTLTGFAAARWRRAENMMHLNEWGLGGRGFGTFVGWFLIGGDLYTCPFTGCRELVSAHGGEWG
jgi:SSS family solute:Na+ symporter